MRDKFDLNGDVLSPQAIEDFKKNMEKMPIYLQSNYSLPEGFSVGTAEFSRIGKKKAFWQKLKDKWNCLVFLAYNGPYVSKPKPIEFRLSFDKYNRRAQQILDLLNQRKLGFSMGLIGSPKPNDTGGMDFEHAQITHFSIDSLH